MTDTAQRLPVPIKPSILASLPSVTGVEVLPAGGAALHLQGGQVVDVPPHARAAINLEYTPLVLRLDSGNSFVIPDLLKLPTLWGLGFDLTGFEPDLDLPLLVGVEALDSNRARLSLSGGYTLTLPRLPRLSLSDIYPDGEALLFTDWRSTTAPAFRIPSRMYAELVAALGLSPSRGPHC